MNTLQPDTETLRMHYGISVEAELAVLGVRERLSRAIQDHQEYFVSIDGSCSLTNEPQVVEDEAQIKAEAAERLENYIGLNRSLCFHKERTDPRSWRGLDTTERVAAYKIIAQQAEVRANGAAEIGSPVQLSRYGLMLAFGWIGGRAVYNTELIKRIALDDSSLPLGIKNGLDGEVDVALKQVKLVEELRDAYDEDTPAILIYRGGDNAKTPKASKDMCKRVIEETGGRVIIDTAHGVEMAHDPVGNFGKSVAGQIAANEMLKELAQEGYVTLGKMSEASAQKSPTDPNMPLAIALEASRVLYEMKMSGLFVPARHRQSQLY